MDKATLFAIIMTVSIVGMLCIKLLMDIRNSKHIEENNPEEITCPVCGYYCSGNGGMGCINKPSVITETHILNGEEECPVCFQWYKNIKSHFAGAYQGDTSTSYKKAHRKYYEKHYNEINKGNKKI